jgi:hypothetical protein
MTSLTLYIRDIYVDDVLHGIAGRSPAAPVRALRAVPRTRGQRYVRAAVRVAVRVAMAAAVAIGLVMVTAAAHAQNAPVPVGRCPSLGTPAASAPLAATRSART